MYWIPEYRFFETDAQIEAALEAIGAGRRQRRRAVYATVLIAPLAAFAILCVAMLFGRWRLPPWLGQLSVTAAVFVAIALVVLNPWDRRWLRRRLREYVVARGVSVCIPCGYDLRGLSDPRCPECGAPFDASFVEPRE